MDNYKKLDEEIWTEFGKELLNKGDQEKGLEFLVACRGGKKSFLQYLDENLFVRDGCVIGERDINFDYKFTESEFLSPPKETQKIIWEAFKDTSDEEKMDCGFWGHIVIGLIKSDSIKSHYLASNNGKGNEGLSKLDSAIKYSDGDAIDKCIRRVLNSMANKSPRGSARVLYDNFSLGRAYWNYHWANQMEEVIGLSVKDILKIFKSIGSYSQFSEKMFSGRSYISHENVLGGLLLFLKDNQIKGKNFLKEIIDDIAFISAWKAIEAQSPEQNRKEITKIIKK